jgi:hypothetical protein
MAFGERITTFEDSEKESEYGYVRKVRLLHPLLLILPLLPDEQTLQLVSHGICCAGAIAYRIVSASRNFSLPVCVCCPDHFVGGI